jgi:hypothetical protein
MVHLIDKSALVAEIEKRIEYNTEWKDACKTLAVLAANQAIEEDKKILSIIDTLEVKYLQEEPVSEELEEASEKCIKELIPEAELNSATPFALEYVVKLLHETFRASAKWQKEQLMKQAIEVQVNPLLGETFVGCKVSGYEVGEKVKIIIIKEGEKC